jgi:hypothetical protein
MIMNVPALGLRKFSHNTGDGTKCYFYCQPGQVPEGQVKFKTEAKCPVCNTTKSRQCEEANQESPHRTAGSSLSAGPAPGFHGGRKKGVANHAPRNFPIGDAKHRKWLAEVDVLGFSLEKLGCHSPLRQATERKGQNATKVIKWLDDQSGGALCRVARQEASRKKWIQKLLTTMGWG